MNKYTRKDISKLFNIGKETLRYYEEIKLMPVAIRDENGYRVYFDEDLLRLEFIIKMKKYGFSLKEISELIKMISDDKDVNKDKLIDYMDDKIDIIKKQINELCQLIKILNTVKENKHLGECKFFRSLITNS